MSKCCGVSPCNCRVTAGTGTTVTGNGSAANPYIISATGGSGTTALAVTDSETIDFDLTGTGTAGDPYEITGSAILDPTPPGGGSNLLQSGPEGLFVECADVRTCFSATDGATYDPATGEIGAKVSTDAGNQVKIGTDGGLYAPPASSSAPTVVQAGDTDTIDATVSGTGTAADPYVVSGAVRLDPTPPQGGSNLIGTGPEGLYLECADVRGCLSAGDGVTYDAATGVIAAKISGDAGNTTKIGADGGIYTPAPAGTALQAADTNTVDTTVSGTGTAADPYVVKSDVIVAPEPNGLEATASGLLVAPSGDAGNQLAMGSDGRLFVPPDPPLAVGCGLQGDGTAAKPLAAYPARGKDAWADHWGCDATQYSTLRCDPNTGFLWTPPEHYSATDHFYIDHMNPAIASMGPTSGWVSLSPGGGAPANVTWNIPPNFLGNMCRDWGYETQLHASIDLNISSTATFEVGYIVNKAGVLSVRPMWGIYTAFGSARRERYAGGLCEAFYRFPAATGAVVIMYPAVRILTGTIGINSWISDASLDTQTRD
ncbi:hypothetical protein AB0N14_18020 [Streptomyces sp. NPDC051104]|uniref:hypothetical protein n=1 Tax=Streptomyces sp. NPDC051104 TaxID=3155044 RepID=UPI003448345C